MEEGKWKKIDEAYDLVTRTAKSAQPKRALLGWKCPACGSKLNTKTLVKEIVYLAAEDAKESNEIGKKILKAADVAPGVYNIKIDRLGCQCGYEFAKADIDPVSD